MEGGHRGATGGRHWAGGLHSCRLLLLIGTVANRRQKSHMLRALPVFVGLILSADVHTEYVSSHDGGAFVNYTIHHVLT